MVTLELMDAANKNRESMKKAGDLNTVPLEPRHCLQAFTDAEANRYALGSLQVNAAEKCVVATDSRVLAIAPIETTVTENVLIPQSLLGEWKPTGKRGKPSMMTVSARNGVVSVATPDKCVSAEQVAGRFPNFMSVVPQGKPAMTIFFDPRLLLKVMRHAAEKCKVKGTKPVIKMQLFEPDSAAIMDCYADNDSSDLLCRFVVMPLDPGEIAKRSEAASAAVEKASK